MAQEGSSAPRRALGPLPDEPGDAPSGGRFGSHALPLDDPSPTTGSRRAMRFAFTPESPASPDDDPLQVEPSTPVPPPVPVLPEPEAALPASAGRRFSASTEPHEVVWAPPRRSAVTAASPVPAPEELLPPAERPTAPPALRVPSSPLPSAGSPSSLPAEPSAPVAPAPGVVRFPQSVPTASTAPASTSAAPAQPAPPAAGRSVAEEPETKAREAEAPEAEVPEAEVPAAGRRRGRRLGRRDRTTAKPAVAAPKLQDSSESAGSGTGSPAVAAAGGKRSAKPALVIMASVVAVALLVSGAVWLMTLRSTAPSGAPTGLGTAAALDPLLTAADLGPLGGVTWVDPATPSEGLRPLCLPAAGAGLPDPQRSVSRRIGSATSEVDAVVQVADTYADEAAAVQAYGARLTQAGTCPDATAWITGASRLNGLADAADSVRLVVQDEPTQYHTLLLTRTGRTVSMVDVLTTAGAVTPSDLATVAARSLSRICGGEQGTCPASIEVLNAVPAAGGLAGWLVEADLPRITPGAGRWGATDPATALSVVGSQCEAVDLQGIAGTTGTGQRTFLLADDAKAPTGFGIDQVVYSFADEGLAKKLARRLEKNLAGCADRAPTATVADGPAVKGTGAGDLAITGSTYLVTQKTETSTMVFRVAVVTVGDQVCYLLANSSPNFDFQADQWRRVALRAGQRVSQG